MDTSDFVTVLIKRTNHILLTHLGKTLETAKDVDVHYAIVYSLREEIMLYWLATQQSIESQDSRRLYYFSMEYLPGKFFSNNLSNLNAIDVVCQAIQKMQRDPYKIFNMETDPSLGNGGLGRLASCILDSLATQQLPAQGYGLRYQYGIFRQEVRNLEQTEQADCWLNHLNPWEFRRDTESVNIDYSGKLESQFLSNGEECFCIQDCEKVRTIPYDYPIIGFSSHTSPIPIITLRLWSTKESPLNFQIQPYQAGQIGDAAENTTLTDLLYPDDQNETGKRIRLKQEFLLCSASLKDIIRNYLKKHENLANFAHKTRIQINDTHPALAIAEMMRLLKHEQGICWETSWEMTQEIFSYTNHTILPEALEEWDSTQIETLLPIQYKIIERINHDFLAHVRKKYPDDEQKVRRMSIIQNRRVRMANLSIIGSHKVNGVAKIHSQIIKDSLFADFAQLTPEKFVNVTNGVTHRRWLHNMNPELSNLISETIGPEWIQDFSQIQKLAEFTDNEHLQDRFLEIKHQHKNHLMLYLKDNLVERDKFGTAKAHSILLSPSFLFDVQIKRFHEYKRQLLNLIHSLMIYHQLKEDSNCRIPRAILFSGKAASGYHIAKNIILLANALSQKFQNDPIISNKLTLLFIENYNVSLAEKIIPAADLSQQISTAGKEASGTGNMKLSMNGALTIGTDDGANIEMRESVGDQWWPFKFGASKQEIEQLRSSNSYDPSSIYSSNDLIQKAINSLNDREFFSHLSDSQFTKIQSLFYYLLHQSGHHDNYFVLHDLESYYTTQLKVEELYKTPRQWAEFALRNIAGMHPFSIDRSVNNYNERIWNLKPTSPSLEEIQELKQQYSASKENQKTIF